MSLHTEFDKGSLIWVKGEIEETLARASEALLQFSTRGDETALRHAQTYLHQACGALGMVDLTGLARFCEEIERAVPLLGHSENRKDSVALLIRGIENVVGYLDRLMAGMSNMPLLLKPLFGEIAALRGGSTSGAELFFPQLQLELPEGLPRKELPATELAAFLRKQRNRYESGLLYWLQGEPRAAQTMASALADVAACQQPAVVRAFWWTAVALALGLTSNRGELDLDSRQLLLRLNLQLRRLADGSSKVAERLFRDMLYALAHMDCDSNLVRHLQRTFALDSLIPTQQAMATGIEQGAMQLARGLREEIRAVKDAWSRIAGGQRDRLSPFLQQLTAVAHKTATLPIPALDQLWKGLLDTLQGYGSSGPSDAEALEFATGLLLADNALAGYPDIAADYPQQVEALLQRLRHPGTEESLPLLDSVSREAQERLLLVQIAQEIRVNLQVVEETLDTYFRDTSNQAGLPGLAAPLRQVQGALLMLDRPQAVQLVEACRKRIDDFIAGAESKTNELEDLAEALSMLGFYVDDLEQGRESEETLRPALKLLCGLVEETVELPAINEVLEAEPELMDDTGKSVPSSPELELAPPLVQESRPLPASEAAIDAELLEVYLEEADEVLATIGSQLEVSKGDPYAREALTLIRRGFHTLKGSGRMVGLFDLGEVAWAVEQVLNKLLQAEKPASMALLELIESTHAAFAGWVMELQRHGRVTVDAVSLIARAEALRDGLDTETEVDPEPVAPVALEDTLSIDEVELVEPAETSDVVTVGDVTISATLFAIFREEAERHLKALQHGIAVLDEHGVLEPGFILAAHTLGGITSTTGFRAQGELSYALEHALQKLGTNAAREKTLLAEVVVSLDDMLGSIFHRAMPGNTPELLARLQAVCAQPLVMEQPEETAEITLDLEEETLPEVDLTVETPESCLDYVVHADEPIPEVSDGLAAEEMFELDPVAEMTEASIHAELAALVDDVAKEETRTVPMVAVPAESGAEQVEAGDVALLDDSADLVIEENLDFAEFSALAVSDIDLGEGSMSTAELRAEIGASVVDDIDEQLLPIFIEEADELMPVISASLHALAEGTGGVEALQQLKRSLHTMKGSARMSGAMQLGEAAHRMESRLEDTEQPGDLPLDRLEYDYDLLQLMLDEVSGRSAPVKAAVVAADTIAQPLMPRSLTLAEPEGKATIRVKSDLVDELVNQAGEVSIARSRIEAEMISLKGSLSDLTENVVRLRAQLREIEIQAESQMQAREKELQEHEAHFDPLEFDRFTRLQELTRFLAESVNDVGNVQQSLLKNLDESNASLAAQARMTRDLQQSLMRVRLVPFNSISERLYRLARTTGKEVGKKVNLELKSGSVEIDRGVLEKMISPFEHMLRNAIDHGLEDTATRLAAGKSEFGEIQIEARQEGNELVLTLRDDGRGLDLERIRAKALEKGLIHAGQQPSEHELASLIFEPGFSTSANVTQLSGRGIGMDVVKNEIGNLGGRIDLQTQPGEGTTFVIRLPLSLAVTQVLLVRSGERTIAIPSALVEQVQELKREQLAELYAEREMKWQGQRYHFAYLPRLLGDLNRQPEQKRYSTVLLLRSGAERIALHIDLLVKNLEVVVKQVGPQLARIPGVVGGTVLGSGEIVLIMNPLLLLPLIDQIAIAVAPAQQTLAAAAQEETESLTTAPVVMVVDDSLTVRKITGRLLAREGFQVMTAKDGVDALQQLQEVRPAVMLVDIEMPRMDGFELTRNIRAAPDTRDIPIIMITSRTADKHRNVAFDLGVNVFLGKPYQEDELLGHVHRFVDVN
ncbi:MAG: Hpt domain-containing protein [Formivibrio sp.]|nr:Hpt domain-containing protein [Formivibrio sp.]